MLERSIQETDYVPESQLCAAANMEKQSVLDIDYIALRNQLNSVDDIVEQSAGNSDYYNLETHSQEN